MAEQESHVHHGRFREIATILVRHGLGYLVSVVGLEQIVPFHKGLLGHAHREQPYNRPEHVRLALGELGAAFIKLGQILSTRADLLPPAYQAELSKLQDAAPPITVAVVRETITAELGRPVEELFATFDPEPLAAASIGQAHAATLPDGTEVVVKVRRPGVVEQLERDLEILQHLTAVASRRWEFADHYDVVGLAQEFAETLRAELDYIREGRNADRFAEHFAGDPAVHIPRVFWELTTARVITLERIRGTKIDDLDALEAAGIDRQVLAQRAARVILKMVFEDGFFHADPHPGNFFIELDGRIAVIDFGMVGTVDERTQDHLAAMLLAAAANDADQMVDAVLDLGVAHGRLDREGLRRDLEHLLTRYGDRPLGELAVGSIIGDTLEVVRRHHLQLPPNLAPLLKTVVMNEGLGARLDPSFTLGGVLAPYAEDLLRRRYAPTRLARRLGKAGIEAARLGADLPQQLRRLLSEIERGSVEVGVRPEGYEPLLRRLERLANRVILGILAAAFVNGLAVLMSVYHPADSERWLGALIAVGFGIAAALGAYLAWAILRSGRG